MSLTNGWEARRPQVYVYTTPQYEQRRWEGARDGVGLVKVGYTERADVETRIREQFPTRTPDGKPYTLLWSTDAITGDGRAFKDHDVHRVLQRRGARRVAGEWFEATVDDVKAAVAEVAGYGPAELRERASFRMRPEQQRAVQQTAAFFRQHDGDHAPHFLWNAKMRFGKTFTAYQLALEMGWSRLLVLTYKPAVEASWRNDLEGHTDFTGWQFKGRGDSFDDLDETKPFVWFASFQDILGRDADGHIKEKNEAAHLVDWDCVIVDEYHYGAWRDAAREFYDTDRSAEKTVDADFSEDTFPLTVGHYLYLSGTPFRALANGEFLEDQIFNWTYSDEQAEKATWPDTLGPNPYRDLPQMQLLTYQMPDQLRQVAVNEEAEFNLNEFFKAEGQPDGTFVFVHANEVQKWLAQVRGQHFAADPTTGFTSQRVPMPFDDVHLLGSLLHTVWYLPSVAACKAMKALLEAPQNLFFHDYAVVCAAGPEAGQGEAALGPVLAAMTKRPWETKTITLTCGKLLTGVTVPAWTGIFMLQQCGSPETYFQAAFRVQSPWTIPLVTPKDGDERVNLKDTCYVFDYAPTRALRQLADYAVQLHPQTGQWDSEEHIVEDFIQFLPVICYDGYSMQPLNAGQLLDITVAGTSSSMLARRWQSLQLVNLDLHVMDTLLTKPDLLASLEQMESFRTLSRDITTLVSQERNLADAKHSKERLSKEEAKQDREVKSRKKQIRENLIKFAARIPVFMYLTDDREETLKDVIEQLEPGLFQKVTGLTLTDFRELVDAGVFNGPVMNSAVRQFKRFEDASLHYADPTYEPPTSDDQFSGFTEGASAPARLQVVFG